MISPLVFIWWMAICMTSGFVLIHWESVREIHRKFDLWCMKNQEFGAFVYGIACLIVVVFYTAPLLF